MKAITITQEELNAAYKGRYGKIDGTAYISGYTDIAEDLGTCTGVGGIQDEDWYFEACDEAERYVAKEYDFERDMLAMPDDRLSLLQTRINNGTSVTLPPDDPHTLAAHYALAYPEDWRTLVDDVREAVTLYYDSEVAELLPDYQKECEKARDYTEKEMRRDFIRGDYRGNFEGIENKLAKYLGAESVTVNDHESVTVEYDEETLKDALEDQGDKRDVRLAKRYTVNALIEGASAYKAKRKAENEKRRAERERTEAYQKEKKEREDAERIARIDAIRRKV